MVAAGKRAVDISVDAREFHRVMAMAKEFDRTYYLKLLAKLRKAGAEARLDSKAEVKKAPMKEVTRSVRRFGILSKKSTTLQDSGKVGRSHRLRLGISKGIKMQIAASERGRKVGVFIVSAGSDPASKALKRSYDQEKGWRHPNYPGKKPREQWTWTQQHGRPGYFGNTLNKHRPQFEAAVKEALDQTVADVAAWDALVAKHNSTK